MADWKSRHSAQPKALLRLVDHGVSVLAELDGRSPATQTRAKAAGLTAATHEALADADLILSIVPPSEAPGVARTFAPTLCAAPKKPVFIDCNAVNPATMTEIAAALAETGCAVLDGAIIGPPPSMTKDPCFYIGGAPDALSAPPAAHGLRVRRIDGPIDAAKTLKMVYAGINKGFVGLGAAMLLVAARAGCAEALRTEMTESIPGLAARLKIGVPDMYPKAYRWVGEMQEIAAFLAPDDSARGYFEAAAAIFARHAEDHAGPHALEALLDAALGLGEQRQAGD